MKRLKKGDKVIILTGKSKKHVGTVLIVKDNLIKVEGANLATVYVKANPNQNQKGGIFKQEAFLNISNAAIYNAGTQKADKIGFKFIDVNGFSKKVRYFKSNGELIDAVS